MGPKKNQNSENVRIKPIKCPYYDRGFCKFGDKCYNKHPDKVCNDNNCSEDKCDKRHPNPCKFGRRCGHNKKNVCLYSHVTFASNDHQCDKTIEDLENEIKVIEGYLKKKVTDDTNQQKEIDKNVKNELNQLTKTIEDKDL